MGTRGLIGLRYKNKDKLTYNHFDSYPSELGVNILKELKAFDGDLKKVFKNIKLVEEGKKPTAQEIKDYSEYSNTGVGEQTKKDWYCLLRDAQGTLKPYFSGKLKAMIDGKEFIKDSLFFRKTFC